MRLSTVSRFPPICFPYFLSLGIFCLNFFLLQLENNLFDKNYQILSLKIILRIKITSSALSVNSPQADERLTTLQSSALFEHWNSAKLAKKLKVQSWQNVWTSKEWKTEFWGKKSPNNQGMASQGNNLPAQIITWTTKNAHVSWPELPDMIFQIFQILQIFNKNREFWGAM